MDTWEVEFEDRDDLEKSTNGEVKNVNTNVGKVERIASAVGGGALIGYAIKNRSKSGIVLGRDWRGTSLSRRHRTL